MVPSRDMETFQQAIVSVGLSLALLPLILLWTTLAGLSWSGPTTWALLLLSALVVIWTSRSGSGAKQTREVSATRETGGSPLAAYFVRVGDAPAGRLYRMASWVRSYPQYPLLAILFLTTLAIRLLAIRDVSIPLWGDSLHHTWLSRLIAERGQAPDSYYPYFPLDSLNYHYGFHVIVAFFSWATGLPVPTSLLILGQVLNAVSVLTVYLLTHRLTHSHTAALFSGLIVGLVSSMPAYYVNWGRYTQMTGQVILPVAVFLAMEAVEKRRLGYAALAAVAAAGLFLTHYRVILFYVAFLAVYYAWRLATNHSPKDISQPAPGRDAPLGLLIQTPENNPQEPPSQLTPSRDAPLGHLPFHKRQLSHLVDTVWLTGIGIIALALVFPRLWYLSANLPRGEASVPQLSPDAWDNWMISYNSLGDLTYYVGWPLILFTGAGFIWALIRKEKVGPIMGGWVALLFAMANSERLGLGRGAWLNNFAVVIALYLPASILAGWVGAQTIGMVGRTWRPARYTLAMLAAAAGIWGAWGMANIVDGKYVLVTPTDQRAMDWIKTNTSPDARFLVNYFFAYGGKYVVGSDGGWWLSYLTGRESTVPPILYGAESSPQRDYAPRVNAIARSLQDNVYTREGLLLMREVGITHIFIGEKGGFLDPNKLVSNGHQAVYRDGPVWVFKVNYSSATP